MKKELLRMQKIKFSQNSIDFVENGCFHVFKSETVGLVGRNHSGKSTLLGAATGEFPCQEGDIWVNEQRKQITSIEDARKAGIFLIKDGSSLISEFTIRNTMKLNFAFVKKREHYSQYMKKCRETLRMLDVQEDTDTRIRDLNFHKRVLIEIAQALVCDASILVFDNVISMLSRPACEQMENIFRMFKVRGGSVILIESQAEGILKYSDRLCVMRKGRVVGELEKGEMERDLILSLMDGERFVPKLAAFQLSDHITRGREILAFHNVYSADHVLKGLNFKLYSNEVLGIWNRNRHSGKAILDVLGGEKGILSGSISIDGVAFEGQEGISNKNIGLYLIPEEDELCTNMNLEENISLSSLKKNSYKGFVKKEGELRYLVHNLTSEYMAGNGYRIFPNQVVPDNVLIQKKTALCRAIAGDARILVYNNPYLKMDYREREIFSQDILKTHKKQIAQLIISAQLECLYPVCSRIIRLDEGKITEVIRK
ncbi:ATP-binding cassette domain-containing protein [Blautia schinkii]|nr:ATP-binding cassette domain-containing protein [Blautia schinkii]